MSYWKHCEQCDAQLGHPVVKDALMGAVYCDRCGHGNELDRYNKDHLFDELLERLQKLEGNLER